MLELPIKATRSPNEGSAVVSITYCSSISYWLNLHKVSSSPILLPSNDRLAGGVSGESLLFIERARPKVPAVFWTRVWGEGKRVGLEKRKNRVMSLKWGSAFKVCLPFLPLIRRSLQRQASEENLCPWPQMGSLGMRVPGLGMCNHPECPSHWPHLSAKTAVPPMHQEVSLALGGLLHKSFALPGVSPGKVTHTHF